MGLPKKLENVLNDSKTKFEPIEHRKVYTAYDLAATLKVEPKQIVKSVLVEFDRDLGLALIPANTNLDLVKLKKTINDWIKKQVAEAEKKLAAVEKSGTPAQIKKAKADPQLKLKPAKKVAMASESKIKSKLTKKVGAIVPFGTLYKLPTFCDRKVASQKKILLNAGTFTDSVIVSGEGYVKAEEPVLGGFSKSKKLPRIKK